MKMLLVCLALLAQTAEPVLSAGSFKWADGRASREAWLDVQAIAEVEPSVEGARAVQALDSGARLDPVSPRVGLWQLSTTDASRVLASLERKLPGHFAPVFHDEPSTASKLRVPVGGVMIWLDASADAAQFVQAHGLVVKQSFGQGTLLVASPPGAASLALATALRSDPAVKTVMPNWWFRAVKR